MPVSLLGAKANRKNEKRDQMGAEGLAEARRRGLDAGRQQQAQRLSEILRGVDDTAGQAGAGVLAQIVIARTEWLLPSGASPPGVRGR